MNQPGVHRVISEDVAGILDADLPWSQLAHHTVLVTGAGGMLPSYTVRTLLALNTHHDLGLRVIGLVRNRARAELALSEVMDRSDFELVVADVSEPLVLPHRVDDIVHGASAARPALHGSNPVGTIRANVLGTINLLDLAIRDRAQSVVLMSSAEIYGRQPADGGLITEDSYGGIDLLDPRSCYSEGKRAAETLCAVYQAQHGLRCRIARFGHVYGPGMALDDGRVQADFTADVIAGRNIELTSAGTATRTYTYVADAVAGLFHVWLRGSDTAYNVADPAGLVSIRDLAELFTRTRPEKGLRLVVADRQDGRSHSPAPRQGLDSTRLIDLGWRPRTDLPQGIDRTVASHEHDGPG